MNFFIISPSASYDPKDTPSFISFSGLYLAESLLKHGFSVMLIDENVENTMSIISQHYTDDTIGFGISTMSGTQLMNAISIAKSLKAKYPHKSIVWGGAHVNALPLQTLSSELVDYICWGEAEQSLPQLLDHITCNGDLSKIKGIGYKKNGVCFITDNAGYTPLDGVFKLPYNLVKMENYPRTLKIGLKRCFSIMTSRGCPFKCKFCSNSSKLWPNIKMRYHTLEHIINDISTLVTVYKADGITLEDENVFVDESRLINICHALNDARFNIKYRTSVRADLLCRLNESTLQLMRETGFIGITVGIESGSQRMLDLMGKGITIEQIYKANALLSKYGFFKGFNFMTCLPGETIDDVRQTLVLIAHIARTSMGCPYPFGNLHKYIPLPNTELFDIAIRHGLIIPQSIEGWASFDFNNIEDTLDTVRPWLKEDLWVYVNSANHLIEELNNLYVGEDSDNEKIAYTIHKLEAFINHR